MQFRLRDGKLKKTVFCVRTVYKPEKKQGVQTTVASFNPDDIVVRLQKVNGDMTEAEIQEANQWHAAYHSNKLKTEAKAFPNDLAKSIRNLINGLETGYLREHVQSAIDPAEIYRLIDDLTRALKKHKIVRSKTKKYAPEDSVSAQDSAS